MNLSHQAALLNAAQVELQRAEDILYSSKKDLNSSIERYDSAISEKKVITQDYLDWNYIHYYRKILILKISTNF